MPLNFSAVPPRVRGPRLGSPAPEFLPLASLTYEDNLCARLSLTFNERNQSGHSSTCAKMTE